jgi:hypothetical protein
VIIERDNSEEFGRVVNAWLFDLRQQQWEETRVEHAANILGLWSRAQWTYCPEDTGGEILTNFLEWSQRHDLSFHWIDHPRNPQ